MKLALVALALVAVASADLTPRQKAVSHLLKTLDGNDQRDIFCDVCVVIIQDLDDFITSDTTEEDIIQFVENVSNF